MADLGKKRKRHSDSTAKPSKKVAVKTNTPISVVKIKVVPNEDDWAPIVVSTPGLQVKQSVALNPYVKQRKNTSARPGFSGTIATKELLLQSSDHPNVDYVGREEEAGGTDSLLKHYVGVYDPTTGNLEVMEARKMTIRGVVRSQQAAPEALRERGDQMNMRDLRNELGQTFGTKKARKAIASITENAISPIKGSSQASQGGSQRHDSVTRTMLDSMAEATKGMATRDELQAMIDEGMPRPKANINAEEVQDIYTVRSLIGDDVLKQIPIKDWADAFKAKSEIRTMSKFVANRIRKVDTDPQRLRVLRYLLYVVEFFRATQSRGKGLRLVPRPEQLRTALADVPKAVLENVRRKFSVDGQMHKFQTDLLITNVCALAMVVDNFEVDMTDLREDLRLEAKEMSTYFREIGARVVVATEAEKRTLGLDKATGAQRKFAKLKIPLDFPKMRLTRRKKK